MTAHPTFVVPRREVLATFAPGRPLHWTDYADLWLNFPLGRVLDYGCGNGDFLRRIAGRATECTGVDVDPQRIAEGVPEIQNRLVVIDPDRPLPFGDRSFDTVIILEVIEHVRDERTVLKELARVLAPGGRMLLTTPHKGLLTFLDPGNFKFAAPRFHRFVHRTILRRKDFYEHQFGGERKAKLGMVADFTIDQNPWHRHYRFEEIRSRTPANLKPLAWAVYFPVFRALWSFQLALKVLTFGCVKHLPRPLRSAYRRMSRRENRWGDQLVILFERQ